MFFTTGNWLAADVAVSVDVGFGDGDEQTRVESIPAENKREAKTFIVYRFWRRRLLVSKVNGQVDRATYKRINKYYLSSYVQEPKIKRAMCVSNGLRKVPPPKPTRPLSRIQFISVKGGISNLNKVQLAISLNF
jgi:hypothetical protein